MKKQIETTAISGLMLVALVLTFLLLQSCKSIQPESTRDAIAIGYVTIETLAESVLVAVESGQVDESVRQTAALHLQLAKNTLDIASEHVRNGDESNAVRSINSAQSLLDLVRGLITP